MRFFIEKKFNFIDAVAIGYASIAFSQGEWMRGIIVLCLFMAISVFLELRFLK